RTGKNFAAGMSGGIAYVFDERDSFPTLCNQSMVNLMQIEDVEEAEAVKSLIRRHFNLTQSHRAYDILKNWDRLLLKFVRVIPKDYQRVVEAQKLAVAHVLPQAKGELATFAENAVA
ncbi:MAG: hypothetical protein ABJB40_04510, partial [Acidobacteriota bacterium]